MPRARRVKVGVISDTHGLLRPEAVAALRGSDVIVHAGDIGAPEVLDALRELAPVSAVRGNNDRGAWARKLPETAILQLGDTSLYVLHDLGELALDPHEQGLSAVIAGHSHKPRCEDREGVLYFNPGSAGPRRFALPIAVGRLIVTGPRVRGEIVLLHP